MFRKTVIIINIFIAIIISTSCTGSYNLSKGQNIVADSGNFVEYVERGDLYNIKFCLDAGADPNTKDSSDKTVLFVAIDKGYSDVVNLLLQKGADPNTIINYGTMLEHALTRLDRYENTNNKQYYKIIELLLNNNANVEHRDRFSKETSLFLAVNSGQAYGVELLLNHGADINVKNRAGENVLMQAAFEGYAKIVELLLENGVNINEVDNYGTTALMFAASKGHTEVVKILLDYGADISLKDVHGITALMKTPANKSEIIRLLKETTTN